MQANLLPSNILSLLNSDLLKMKILLFLFLFQNLQAYCQTSTLSGEIVNINHVDFFPAWEDCKVKGIHCTIDAIKNEVIREFNSKVFPTGKEDEEVIVIIKFIIDTSGKVAWATALGPSEDIRNEGIRIVKNFPPFRPGRKAGEKVNVLIDFPIIMNYGKFHPEMDFVVTPSEEIDTPAHFRRCRKEENPKACTSTRMLNFINNRVRKSRVSKGVNDTTLRFIIDLKGEVQNVIAEGYNENFNKEAIRVIQKLPRFIPAIRNGQPVNSVYLLPITATKY